MIENLIFGRSGFNTTVFEKHFISYSCILFIKYYALRIFCIKLLCFSKNLIFPNVRSIEPVARSIEIMIKNLLWICLFRLVLDRCWINWKHFWSIESNFRSIKNRIESFFKTLSFHVFFTIQNFFKKLFLSLSLRLVRFKVTIFVVLPQIFSRVFVFIHQ